MGGVLVIAGCRESRARLRASLAAVGWGVEEAESGPEAALRNAEPPPAVVVVDGDGDEGLEELRQVREIGSFKGVPILYLTSGSPSESLVRALEGGADDASARDVPPEVVRARVGCLMRRRQLERLTALNERLAQLGRLVAGIVHEIRGPLSVIGGNAEVILMSLPPGEPALVWAEPILRTTRLLQTRLEYLMAAVRAGPPDLKPVELPAVAREAINLFVKATDPRRARVTVAEDFAPGLPPARADAGRLIQALINLLVNAQDAASGDKAHVVVRAAAISAPDGPWLTLEVRDDGPGIPEGDLERIFEPFYTTKADGSGYGLYLAREILREHGGRLTACNGDGGGACFTLWLPLAEGAGVPSA